MQNTHRFRIVLLHKRALNLKNKNLFLEFPNAPQARIGRRKHLMCLRGVAQVQNWENMNKGTYKS